jgi:hypothetical protein
MEIVGKSTGLGVIFLPGLVGSGVGIYYLYGMKCTYLTSVLVSNLLYEFVLISCRRGQPLEPVSPRRSDSRRTSHVFLFSTQFLPRVMSSANQNAISNKHQNHEYKQNLDGRKTYSLPVQKVEASDASQAITPLSSSGRPSRPSGFKLDHLSNKCGCLSRYAAVML